jgi:hypothetical protein
MSNHKKSTMQRFDRLLQAMANQPVLCAAHKAKQLTHS